MATTKKLPPVVLEGCHIKWRNFAGVAKMYNAAGERNFVVALDEDTAKAMIADGWNIKFSKPYEEGDEPQPFIKVKIELDKGRPPNIVMISSRGRTKLTPELLEMLDYADIDTADVMFNSFFWEMNGKSGYNAYLKTLFVTIREDPLELKYADIDEVGVAGLVPDDQTPF